MKQIDFGRFLHSRDTRRRPIALSHRRPCRRLRRRISRTRRHRTEMRVRHFRYPFAVSITRDLRALIEMLERALRRMEIFTRRCCRTSDLGNKRKREREREKEREGERSKSAGASFFCTHFNMLARMDAVNALTREIGFSTVCITVGSQRRVLVFLPNSFSR